MGRRMAKVAYGWTVTTLSHLRVDAWPKSPTGGRLHTGRYMAKVAYGWTVTILSYLRVDA